VYPSKKRFSIEKEGGAIHNCDMGSAKVFSSHSLEHLLSQLDEQLREDELGLFSKHFIVVPSPAAKEWIQRELAKRRSPKAILGMQFKDWQEGLKILAGPLPLPKRNELLCALWTPLHQILGETHSEKKQLDLVEGLADLFLERYQFGAKLFPEWIEDLWTKVATIHGWKTLKEALGEVAPKHPFPFYLFGMDILPKEALQFFLQHQNPRVFRFSPCAMFWEDFRSHFERKYLMKKWQRMDSEKVDLLESFLKEANPLLSNWGVLGRKQLAAFDEDRVELFEEYPLKEEGSSQLDLLKRDFLLLEKSSLSVADPTLTIAPCGVSKMDEVRFLQEEILKSEVPFHDIRIYAPHMETYLPLLEFVFHTKERQIPLRIGGKDVAVQSSFYTALDLFFKCVRGRWAVEEILKLLEAPAFYRKVGISLEEVRTLTRWVEKAKIRGGINGAHRREFFEEASNEGTWEQGVDFLVDAWTRCSRSEAVAIPWSEADGFESFLNVLDRLQQRLFSWREEKSLGAWAEEIEKAAQEFLVFDEKIEADRLMQTAFSRWIWGLRSAFPMTSTERFPHSFVWRQWRLIKGGEGGALHAIACASLEEGSIFPAKLIFVLGMDEEAFPRRNPLLGAKRLKTQAPSQGERDRYLFLQLLFAAQERLVMSYCERSEEDGKEVHPSLLIQELCAYIGLTPSSPRAFTVNEREERTALVATMDRLPDLEKRRVVSIQELTSFVRSSIGYYLEKVLGIRRKEEEKIAWQEWEWTFLSQYTGIQAALSKEEFHSFPVGTLGRAAQKKMGLKTALYEKHLESWKVKVESIETLSFKETTLPLDLSLADGTPVRLVGEVSWVVPGGILYFGEDSIQGVLKKWAEILAAFVAQNGRHIFSLQTGRIREVEEPKRALEALVTLFLRCQKEPLFFDPEWADPVLRQGTISGLEGETNPLQWALRRNLLDVETHLSLWAPTLQTTFASLISLFPVRSRAEV
jgi:exonuclease V gamma subunit